MSNSTKPMERPTYSFTRELSPDEAPSPSKRRKLRKGTQSCWECKRRKARCTFSAANQGVCEGCKRRGTDCVSQESTDQPPPQGSNRHVVDRLGEVEMIVGRLLEAASHGRRMDSDAPSPVRPEPRRQTQRDDSNRFQSPSTLCFGSMAHVPATPVISDSRQHHESVRAVHGPVDTIRCIGDSSTGDPSHPDVGSEQNIPSKNEDELCRALRAVWPCSQDLEAILKGPVETSSIIRAVTCTQMSTDTLPPVRTLLQMPPPGSHPVLIARKLLILATYIQGIPLATTRDLEGLGMSCQDIMSRIVITVRDLVTCKDELVSSLEGMECIMLEALYENYAGKLRRSWLTARRGIMIAQMLGTNRGIEPPSLTRTTVNPNGIWFRLVQFDRYLSLMLGLPQSSPADTFADPKSLEHCVAIDRLHRICGDASGLLLQRTPAQLYDTKTTKNIDKLLQDASQTMPAQWWITPVLHSQAGQLNRIHETLRFNDQCMHHHLLLQLHLPYLLCQTTERKHEYNRTTAVTASCELLSRIISFRTYFSGGCYCRGTDILTFVASTSLFLAHIRDRLDVKNDEGGSHFLAHQRLSDRGLLERTLADMRAMASLRMDALSNTVATLLNYILTIEDDMANGGKYIAGFSSESMKEHDLGCLAKLSNDDTILKITIPNFSTINIEREKSQVDKLSITMLPQLPNEDQSGRAMEGIMTGNPALGAIWKNLSLPQLTPLAASTDSETLQDLGIGFYEPGSFEDDVTAGEWALQDMDMSFLDDLIEENPQLSTA